MRNTGKTPIQPRVLIADDDPSTRLIMREVLEQAGFDVVEAADGKEALRCYESTAPDVILLDVEMPQLDGFSVCQEIRKRETARKTPICIVTGLDDDRSVDRAYHIGATDFIGKPIAWPVLAHRLRYILRANEALNEIGGLILALPDTVFVLNDQGQTTTRVTDLEIGAFNSLGTVKGLTFEDIIPEEDRQQVRECVRLTLLNGEPQIHEHRLSGSNVYVETRFVARDRHSVLAIVRDVTERKKAELKIYDLAFYDQLTGLPNRQLFSNRLETVINAARAEKQQCSILFVDLDRFKRINDTLGHTLGDILLKTVATRLQSCLRSADHVVQADQEGPDQSTLARLGGDEFVIVLRDVGSEDAAAAVASRIISSLSEPLSCEGHQFVVTPSIGIAIYPQDGDTLDELLMNADAAMYRSKAAGRNTFSFYSDTMKVKSLHRLDLENELRRAIDDPRRCS